MDEKMLAELYESYEDNQPIEECLSITDKL